MLTNQTHSHRDQQCHQTICDHAAIEVPFPADDRDYVYRTMTCFNQRASLQFIFEIINEKIERIYY